MKIVSEVNLTSENPIKVGKFNVIHIIKLSVILNAVCEVNEVAAFDVKGKRRFNELMTARREYCYLAWKLTKLTERNPYGNSLSVIGAEIGKSHANVLHHKDKVIDWLEIQSYGLVEKLEMIEAKLSI